jgi:ubiquinone/menaquinone biosynthesis C-methylase UbiE
MKTLFTVPLIYSTLTAVHRQTERGEYTVVTAMEAAAEENETAATSSPPRADRARELFDRWAPGYDEQMRSWGYDGPEYVAQMLFKAGLRAGAHILDLGCGTGLGGRALREMDLGTNGGIVGVDISDKSLDVAITTKVYQDTLLHNIEEPLPFPDMIFDAVVCISVTPYVDDLGKLLSEMCRVAKPGGLCCWTHPAEAWDADERGCVTAALRFEEELLWKKVCAYPPREYLPAKPLRAQGQPSEAGDDEGEGEGEGARDTHQLVVYRRLHPDVMEAERKRFKQEQVRQRREGNVAVIEETRQSQSSHAAHYKRTF